MNDPDRTRRQPMRIVFAVDAERFQEGWRYFHQGSRRLAEASRFISEHADLLPVEFVKLLDGAVTDLMEARTAMLDAHQMAWDDMKARQAGEPK